MVVYINKYLVVYLFTNLFIYIRSTVVEMLYFL